MAEKVRVKVEGLRNEGNVVQFIETGVNEKEGCKGCRDVRLREIGVKLREEELSEFNRELVARKKQIEEEFMVCCNELSVKKEELIVSRREQVKELETELEELSRKWKDLEVKEREVKEGFELLEAKRRELRVKEGVLMLRKGRIGNVEEGFELLEAKRRGLRVKGNVGGGGGRVLRGLSKVIESRLKEGWGVVVANETGFEGERDVGEDEVIACERLLELRDVDEGCGEEKTVDEGVVNEDVCGVESTVKALERERWVEIELREKRLKDGFDALEARAKEVDERRMKMEVKEQEMSTRCWELGARGKQINKRSKALDLRERCFNKGAGLNAKEVKGKEVDEWRKEMERVISERCQEIETREEMVNSRSKGLDLREECLNEDKEVFEKHCVEIELRKKQLNTDFDDIKVEEKKLVKLRKEIELKEREIGAREKKFDSHVRDFDLRQQKFSVQCQKVAAREKQVRRRKRYLELREKSLQERNQAQVSKEKELDGKLLAIEVELGILNERKQALELIQKQVDENCQSLKVQEKKVREIYAANVIIEKDLREYRKTDAANSGDDHILKLCNTMSGKALQMYLNERFMEHQSMKDRLWNALKLSSDPAKLVLSTVYGFYPPHLERAGGLSFDTRAVRISCTTLLEYLVNLNVFVSEPVKTEAVKVVKLWKDGIVAEGASTVVVLGFLLLLAGYNLGSMYEARELQRLLEVIDQHRLAPIIRRRLGLSKPKNDPQSGSNDRKKRTAASTESPGQEKHARVDADADADQMFSPYNPPVGLYGPPPGPSPRPFQYPVLPPPPACYCIPPCWCSICRPLPYTHVQFQFPQQDRHSANMNLFLM